jgi:hypothetical protein
MSQKGEHGGECGFGICSNTPACWKHSRTGLYYCADCAKAFSAGEDTFLYVPMRFVTPVQILTPDSDQPMTLERFQAQAQTQLDALQDLIENFAKDDGDTEKTSQRICLINRLNKLRYAFNGTTQNDLK